MQKVEIIAEAGVNHNGEAKLAFELVDVAAASGADVVKFQTFKANELVASNAPLADYQSRNTSVDHSQLSLLSSLELDFATFVELKDYSERLGVNFLSTAFDDISLRFLVDEMGLKRLKVPSGEITNAPLLLEHARSGCDLILSSGMATLAEIEEALGIVAFGMLEGKSKPSRQAFREAYCSNEARDVLKNKVTLMHCTSEYPAAASDINLSSMVSMKNLFGMEVGFSDHSEGIGAPVAATALGARIVEKHFTLDKEMSGPDHKASLNPQELAHMVVSIREAELALGSSVKVPSKQELKNALVTRKSLIATKKIANGQSFSEQNLGCKRPGTGISPFEYWDYINKTSSREYMPGDMIGK